MRIFPGLALAIVAMADERGLAPLSRGVFQDWVGSETRGTFSFETADKKAYKCDFNSRTYFEREHKKTSIQAFGSGQQVEVLSERTPEPPRCRALIVRVLTPKTLESPRYGEMRSIVSATESFAPRGHLIYTGVVTSVDDKSFELVTREGKRHSILFRVDTRIGSDGLVVDRRAIPGNKTVQVRAGRTFDNFIEAYSVFWGAIFKPIDR